MFIGYARISTSDQTLAPQEDELRRAGCEQLFSDVESGARADRPGLAAMVAQARRGDVVTVVRLDRLGRSLVDLVATVQKLKGAGVGFRSLSEQIDTTTAGGKLIFHIFASLSEFERTLIQERTRAGLSSARARGRIGGRPRDTDTRRQAMAAALLSDPGNSIVDVCRVLKVSRATAYRLARKGQEQHQPPPAATTPARTPIRAATATGKAARAERGVPPQAASRLASTGEKGKAASSPKKPARTASQPKTLTAAKQPRKGNQTAKKRKP